MSYIQKPSVTHPKLPRNDLGLATRDYEGVVSTLCAGCGHDSITAAIIQAVFELNIEPHRLGKMSGIGCSSKTPAYFVSQSHGFNSVHGRMPSVTTGANAANPELVYIGVSGDGDSLSIGMAQFAHVIRRNLNMCYIIENNGVYGLTKGQFSASADVGAPWREVRIIVDQGLMSFYVDGTKMNERPIPAERVITDIANVAAGHAGVYAGHIGQEGTATARVDGFVYRVR